MTKEYLQKEYDKLNYRIKEELKKNWNLNNKSKISRPNYIIKEFLICHQKRRMSSNYFVKINIRT